MSNVYVVGTKVVCPAVHLYNEKSGTTHDGEGTIVAHARNSINTPIVKWSNGKTAETVLKHIMTKDKYDELVNAGLSTTDIIQYLEMFNGHLYN